MILKISYDEGSVDYINLDSVWCIDVYDDPQGGKYPYSIRFRHSTTESHTVGWSSQAERDTYANKLEQLLDRLYGGIISLDDEDSQIAIGDPLKSDYDPMSAITDAD